jgi:hypothetical protein
VEHRVDALHEAVVLRKLGDVAFNELEARMLQHLVQRLTAEQ